MQNDTNAAQLLPFVQVQAALCAVLEKKRKEYIIYIRPVQQ